MLFRYIQAKRRVIFTLTALLLACVSLAGASAVLLVEEPYGGMGFFTGTGHAAVYLPRVCADSPAVLRMCGPGEPGIVISRYDGVDRYDWLAIPLIPYLYAVERPEDVPLFADAHMVFSLRDHYRRQHLEDVAGDAAHGAAPGGIWYELVGTAYDRAVYGFQFDTTPEQDEALIRELNAGPNRSHFHLLSHNCADFAKSIINFYYPKSAHRSVVADLGITTPKQLAIMLVKFNEHHPELGLTRFVIAQVPGSMPRSTPIHGVVESILKSKKYIVPSAIASPIFAGGVFAVYVGTGEGRFQPDRGAQVFHAGAESEPPISRDQRKAYRQRLKNLLAEVDPASEGHADKEWAKVQSRAKTGFDEQGSPILLIQDGEHRIQIGASAANVLTASDSREFARQMLAARLESELRHSSPHAFSEGDIARDWDLFQRTLRLEKPSEVESSAGSMTAMGSLPSNVP